MYKCCPPTPTAGGSVLGLLGRREFSLFKFSPHIAHIVFQSSTEQSSTEQSSAARAEKASEG
jgi:hypothetical protein